MVVESTLWHLAWILNHLLIVMLMHELEIIKEKLPIFQEAMSDFLHVPVGSCNLLWRLPVYREVEVLQSKFA